MGKKAQKFQPDSGHFEMLQKYSYTKISLDLLEGQKIEVITRRNSSKC